MKVKAANTAFFSKALTQLLLSLCLVTVQHVSAETFYSYPVIDLGSGESQSLSPKQPLNVVLFFEPNCSWCFKQSKVFNHYQKHCSPHVHFIGLGVNANRQALKQAAWKLNTNFPLYMASPKLLEATGKITSTPLTIVFDIKGNILAHIRGYVSANKWHQLMQQHTAQTINCLV